MRYHISDLIRVQDNKRKVRDKGIITIITSNNKAEREILNTTYLKVKSDFFVQAVKNHRTVHDTAKTHFQ